MSHDDLIHRLRRKAWDPARRHDVVYVPLIWLKREYGDNVTMRIRHYRQPHNEDYLEAGLESGAPEAVKYFSGVPHEPLYLPISEAHLHACEQRIGQELPELLRRVYTEVGNGGFGPSNELLGLPPGGHLAYGAGPDALELYEDRPELSVLGFPLVAAGCSMYWYMSLTQPDNPVCLWDGDGYFPKEQSPEVGIVTIAPSLAEWFDGWVNGYNWFDHPWFDHPPIPRNDPSGEPPVLLDGDALDQIPY